MKDLKEVLQIALAILLLTAIIVIVTTYNNNTGTGQIAEQARIAKAYPEQVPMVEKLASANRTNAQADATRAQAESTRAWTVVFTAGGLVLVLLLIVAAVRWMGAYHQNDFR